MGESGEKKVLSCPTTTEVSFQSIRMLAVRKRKIPELTPFHVLGYPPAKSACKLPEVFAPASVGPENLQANFATAAWLRQSFPSQCLVRSRN